MKIMRLNKEELTLYYNAFVITMNEDKTIYDKGAFLVKEGKIADIGESDQLIALYPDAKKCDLSGKIVMPGFINTHTHIPMVLFRGLADDLPLKEWLEQYIWPMERKMVDENFIKWGTMLGMMEMISTGTTTFADMYFFEETIADVVKAANMRAVLGEGIIDFKTPDAENPQEDIEKFLKLSKKWHKDKNIKIAMCAHSPYTCSAQLLKETKRLADDYKTIFHIHVAETKIEKDLIRENERGLSVVKYLENLGILDKNVLAAHSVWLDDEDIMLYKKYGVKVSHNISSNMKLGSGRAPIEKYIEKGVLVSLGTDGAASNNSLNMFNEIRLTALIHKGITANPTVADAYSVLEMATINGAKALGIDDITGSLELGKFADFIVISTDYEGLKPLYNPISHLVYASSGRDVEKVYVGGELIYRNGEYFTIDKEKVLSETDKIRRDIVKNLHKS